MKAEVLMKQEAHISGGTPTFSFLCRFEQQKQGDVFGDRTWRDALTCGDGHTAVCI